MPTFPNEDWLQTLMAKLNSDESYAQIARNWEGDMIFEIHPGGSLSEPISFYMDLWHGKCRDAYIVDADSEIKSVFTLHGSYDNYVRLLKGDIAPMQALLTRKIGVKGNMGVLMRNVPTVLDFVRCCKEITDSYA